MTDWLLSILTFVPLFGAMILLVPVRGISDSFARVYALAIMLIEAAVTAYIFFHFDPTKADFQYVENVPWIVDQGFTASYHRGIDGIGLWMLAITAFTGPLAVLCAWKSITTRVRAFMAALLVLQGLMVGVFSSLDLLLFLVFFEATLIPTFLMIALWGGEKRMAAAYRFFVYTFAGSVFMLLAVIFMALHGGTTDMQTLMHDAPAWSQDVTHGLWLAFFLAFAVKMAVWPFHTWAPMTYAEAPTPAVVVLSGVLLKMGGYGLLRINAQMLPDAAHAFVPLVLGLSVIGIVYTSLVALVQTDMRRMLAYASVAHMGFMTLGLFSGGAQGVDSAMYVMLSHTCVMTGLFMAAGMMHDRLKTYDMQMYGGLASTMPRLAFFSMILMLAAVGLPGTSGFVGECLALIAAWAHSPVMAFVAGTAMVVGAGYMLVWYRRLFYGPVTDHTRLLRDLSIRETVMLAFPVALVIALGLAPWIFGFTFVSATQGIAAAMAQPSASMG